MTRRPNKKTVERVMQWLEHDLGLNVYGGAVDLDTGLIHHGCMDYSSDDVEKLAKHIRNETLTKSKEPK